MRFNLFIFPFLFLFLSIDSFAQKNTTMKWGKVPSADLQMVSYAPEPDARAVVLGDVGSATFDLYNGSFSLIYKRHRRVKILKKSGIDKADVFFSYYGHRDLEKLITLKAQVIQPDGSVIKVERSQIFETNEDGHYTKVSFSFPRVSVGSVVEYKYELQSAFTSIFNTWYFQEDIPVRLSQYTIAHPDELHYILDSRQIDKFKLAEDEYYQSTGIFNVSNNGNFYGIPQTDKYQMTLNMSKKVYLAKDVPALHEEPHLPTILDYSSRITAQLKGSSFGGGYRPIFSEWKDIARWAYESEYLGKVLKTKLPSDVVAAVKAKCAKIADKKEKIKVVHETVREMLNWNGFYRKTVHQNFMEMYKTKSTNSAGLSLMLIALLNEVGINAYPALVGTRDFCKTNRLLPFIYQFNHVLCFVKLDGENLLMDVVDKNISYDLLSQNSQNGVALALFDKKNFEWIEMNTPKSRTTISIEGQLNEENQLAGEVSFAMNNFVGSYVREELKERDAEAFFEDLFLENSGEVMLENLEMEGVEETTDMISGKAQFTLDVENTGELVYLAPFLGIGGESSPFKVNERELPIDFDFPLGETYILKLTIPEGYAVESLPEKSIVTLMDKVGKFQFMSSVEGQTIQLMSRTNLNETFFLPENYPFLKQFFDSIVNKHAEQIVLKKL